MKISNHILVGVEFPKLCEYYHDVRAYANELNEQYEDSVNEELIAVSAYIINETETPDKEVLRIDYYTIAENGTKQYTYYTDKDGKDVSWSVQDTNNTLEDIAKTIKKQDHVYDLDYFLKNN